jgi:hypothetical protein
VIFSVGKGTDDDDDNSKLFYFRKAPEGSPKEGRREGSEI